MLRDDMTNDVMMLADIQTDLTDPIQKPKDL